MDSNFFGSLKRSEAAPSEKRGVKARMQEARRLASEQKVQTPLPQLSTDSTDSTRQNDEHLPLEFFPEDRIAG